MGVYYYQAIAEIDKPWFIVTLDDEFPDWELECNECFWLVPGQK